MSRVNSSVLWEYFDKTNLADKKAKCRVCGDSYSYKGTTGNLKAHLKKRHLDAYSRVVTGQQEMRTPQSQATSSATATTTTNFESDPARPSTSANTGPITIPLPVPTVQRSNVDVRQQGIERYSTVKKISGELKRKIDCDLLDLFIDSYHPFTLVEERAFKKFIRWIPGYQPPTRKTISNVMIPALYQKIKETLKMELGPNTGVENVCLTSDLWTSRANESYLAVTGHFMTEDLHLKSILLDCAHFEDSHTSDNVQNVLNNIVQEYQLANKINFVVTDNAANMQKAINNIGWKHYGCYGHNLNLILKHAITTSESLQLVIEKVKKIVRFFKTSSTALEQLLKAQTIHQPNCIPKRLIQEVPTRWNSTYHMIQRFVELEQFIRYAVAGIRRDLPIISNENWLLLAQIAKILKPFDDATESMSGEKYMTASSVIVMTRCLIRSCDKLLEEDFIDVAQELILNLRTGLITKFHNIERSGTFSVCTFVDPRYKLAVFSDENEAKNTKKRIQDLLTSMIGQEIVQEQTPVSLSNDNSCDKFSPWAILGEIVGTKQTTTGTPLSKAIREIDTYLNDDPLPVFNGTSWNCPIEWWRQHRFTYPYLARLFKKHGNIMATSVPCERIFSKTGLIINDRRTRLTSTKVKQLAFLNVNMDSKRFDS